MILDMAAGAMTVNVLVLLAGLLLLTVCADKFIDGAAGIAKNLGVSPLLIGITIVGIGTSMPEILVSSVASWQGSGGLAMGNAVGSNIANVGLILGCAALVSPLTIHSGLLKREMPLLLLVSVAAFLVSLDGLGIGDGLLLQLGLALFLVWLVQLAKRERAANDPVAQEMAAEMTEKMSMLYAVLLMLAGLVGLLLGSKALVWSAVNIAQAFGVSDLVIGLTIVAVGTSLPELAASVASTLKDEDDLAVGNVVGSNIFNLLAVYSIPGVFAIGHAGESLLYRDFPVMLGFTLVLFMLGFKAHRFGKITRLDGGLLLTGYAAYLWLIYQSSVASL